MVQLNQVVDVLETLYPLRYAEDWDHPGLIVGDLADQVHRIVFAADPTTKVIDDAIASGADLVVTHHPLFFRAVHEVSGKGFRGEIVAKLYRAHCALWVGHTNADAAWRGVAQAAADTFGLVDQVPMVPIADDSVPHAVGEGRVGELAEPMTLGDFARKIAAALPRTEYGVQVSGPLDMPVKTVAVLPGSGDSMFGEVNALGVDVYVTSDLRHHPATDEMQQSYYEAAMRGRGIPLGHGPAVMGGGHAAGALGEAATAVRPALINTPHSAIESLWFNYALVDVPAAIERVCGERVEARWDRQRTDPWDLAIRN
ncbi:Nif3-like dinuclear metal center hexameric protein [Bifidobacterium choloepi]|uniref:GTP cyclohydrolase 1 type 2 homolog n=1 Tax=Bifidobacterium choloepi TaxID=2614131 RepID=A0A6I5NG09_9BIFI|nr:Nif3-like dinuclear metal center hexameric protein [Bifidobacterium choloepi]NEG69293.1 Nif3-like dinuclear metal center hexameric protein [Bifidobacterium choloepi]